MTQTVSRLILVPFLAYQVCHKSWYRFPPLPFDGNHQRSREEFEKKKKRDWEVPVLLQHSNRHLFILKIFKAGSVSLDREGQWLIRSAAGWRIYIQRGSGIWSPLLGIPVGECRCHIGRLGRRPRTEAVGGPEKVTIWLLRRAPVHLLEGRCSGRGLCSGWPSRRRPCTRAGPSRIRFRASPGSLWPGQLASQASLRAKWHLF